ncbi:MAG: YHS domain-containing protein [Acidimicrobiia bacterium]|nr:YHS domain-containing protein [Acidimicrobiia bacterium]MYE71758.1 YHS domain-containing protein [Acidimicrobiia bacterium]MYJ62431.1 YHS domain-containing protein [Acidimicrobiia bacterium]
MNVDVLARAVELRRLRLPFVLASVIWRRAPSSGQQGSQAVILSDGTVRGWLGGACAEPTVIVEALACLDHGQPRLLCLGPSNGRDRNRGPVPGQADDDSDGLRSIAMACDSEGAMEIYLEPNLPAPQVVVIGRSPAVDAIAAVATAIGWDAVIIDDGGQPDDHEHPELVRTSLDLSSLAIDPATAVVVATQGHYDDVALAAALGTNAGYIGLVASAKRAQAMSDYLRTQGFGDDDLTRISAPAGLDLGRIPNREIAAAILADLVARRAEGWLEIDAEAAPQERPQEAVDPVCGMSVLVADARYRAAFNGSDYYFCAAGCQQRFEADPAAFVA